jgi:SAM-dependent MidA family methyltransferase
LLIENVLRSAIRERGPLTVAAFMDLALYDPAFGYYARASQRSGRAGDFFTSVDVGPLFGELLERQLEQMSALLASATDPRPRFDLVEAGAGNGRLAADILHAARGAHASFYDRVRLHLVEASAAARAEQAQTLGSMADRLASSAAALPDGFEGVLLANELLDALPTHQVVMRPDGLREVYVDVETGDDQARLITREGPPSTPALAAYLDRLAITLEPGWRVEINLRAIDWIGDAARRLSRGFIVIIDYGHPARELYSHTHATGTLTTFARHTMSGPESALDRPMWLRQPGEQDITAHVDFTSVQAAAEGAGLTLIGFLDQTYFLLGLANLEHAEHRLRAASMFDDFGTRLALKTLLMPGGLGSTHKVLILGKDVGTPVLQGCSYGLRVT